MLIAENGKNTFYNGSIGENIIKTIKSHKGLLCFDDLSEYKSTFVELIHTDYRNCDIYEMPLTHRALLHF